MAAHSSVLAWRTPGTGEPGGLHRVGHDGSDSAAAAAVLIYPPQSRYTAVPSPKGSWAALYGHTPLYLWSFTPGHQGQRVLAKVLFCFLLDAPCDMWNLSSPTRDGTCAP